MKRHSVEYKAHRKKSEQVVLTKHSEQERTRAGSFLEGVREVSKHCSGGPAPNLLLLRNQWDHHFSTLTEEATLLEPYSDIWVTLVVLGVTAGPSPTLKAVLLLGNHSW